MKSQSYERLWPPLLKLKWLVGNGWLTSNCCNSSCQKINSGFQFQFQFHGFQFQFHFQFHQFQFQFQFLNWNWNWAAIPIPELNWPQPCLAPGNMVWYDTRVPGIWTVWMDNVNYLNWFWMTDPIPLQTFIAIFSFGTGAYLNNSLSIMGPQPKYMTINYPVRHFAR